MKSLTLLLVLLAGCATPAPWEVPAEPDFQAAVAERCAVSSVSIGTYLGDRSLAEEAAREAGYSTLEELLRSSIEARLQAATAGGEGELQVAVEFALLSDRWVATPWFALVPFGFLYVPLGQRLVEAEAVFVTRHQGRVERSPFRMTRERNPVGLLYGGSTSPGQRLGQVVDRFVQALAKPR